MPGDVRVSVYEYWNRLMVFIWNTQVLKRCNSHPKKGPAYGVHGWAGNFKPTFAGSTPGLEGCKRLPVQCLGTSNPNESGHAVVLTTQTTPLWQILTRLLSGKWLKEVTLTMAFFLWYLSPSFFVTILTTISWKKEGEGESYYIEINSIQRPPINCTVPLKVEQPLLAIWQDPRLGGWED